MDRVALIEDHERMARVISGALAAAGIEADTFARIEHAAAVLTRGGYALAIVDRGMPDGDGLDLVRRLRRAGHRLPCLMLTARDALHDRVAGLEAGADDYLPKPFAMEELVARVRALMRRPLTMKSLAPEYGGLQVRPQDACMACAERTAALAPAELQIMLSLIRARGEIVSRSAIESAAWGYGEVVTSNALDVALHRLRKKLSSICSELEITNVRGHGYALR